MQVDHHAGRHAADVVVPVLNRKVVAQSPIGLVRVAQVMAGVEQKPEWNFKYLGDFRYKTDSLDSVFATNQPAK